MKYIFLDFDGVLNSTHFMRSAHFLESTAGLTDPELYLLQYGYMLDPEPIKLVNDLVEKTGAKVVASTSHRIRYSLEELDAMLAKRGATFQFSGKTPRLLPKKFSQCIDRGDEIQAFLDELSEKPEAFVILDDLNNMVHLTPYLVLTSDMVGLTTEDAEKALKILNGESI
jgi:HAD domain in Swiss Army Knife RNA repair proteins